MTEFDFDCLEKKRLARCAAAKVRNHRTVTLPSDGLTQKDLQDRNGPCRVYHLGRPMTLNNFLAMPRDLQRSYLRRLDVHGGSPDTVAAMWGMDTAELLLLLRGYGVRLDNPDAERWRAFMRR